MFDITGILRYHRYQDHRLLPLLEAPPSLAWVLPADQLFRSWSTPPEKCSPHLKSSISSRNVSMTISDILLICPLPLHCLLPPLQTHPLLLPSANWWKVLLSHGFQLKLSCRRTFWTPFNKNNSMLKIFQYVIPFLPKMIDKLILASSICCCKTDLLVPVQQNFLINNIQIIQCFQDVGNFWQQFLLMYISNQLFNTTQ